MSGWPVPLYIYREREKKKKGKGEKTIHMSIFVGEKTKNNNKHLIRSECYKHMMLCNNFRRTSHRETILLNSLIRKFVQTS